MPSGRAVLLLRRLSGDGGVKNINLTHNSPKETLVPIAACSHRDFSLLKRLSTYTHTNLQSPNSQQTRNLSDNIIKMTTPRVETSKPEKHTNRLINEKSPYLLQHANNPVDWYPWGQEAIDKAKAENKLIFLSVGYSTCHWCHVMEKESFENEDVARVMNDHFINIKVDREERPDIDRVYMMFITATFGRGGWPMSVFMTPDLKPVTGGTYFPPEDRWGKPGFKSILLKLSTKWKDDQQQFYDAGVNIMNALQKMALVDAETSESVPGETVWNKCVQSYMYTYESDFGGFGTAPKFPQASIFNLLFHFYARDKTHPEGKKCLDMCLHTLTKIAKGGIHDHISSGFARYSVDNDWHVPHFEKMLYDQAQLTVAYSDAFLATQDEFYADVVRDIIKYVNRDLRHESGGYYSAEDADSYPFVGAKHKEEGAFCVWEYDEIKSLLEEKVINSIPYFDVFAHHFSVEECGNISPESDPHGELKNKNVLIVYGSNEESAEKFGLSLNDFNQVISECVEILYKKRQDRPRPHLDSKMLCSWNGLMIAGLAQAGQALEDTSCVENAIKAASFIKKYLYNECTKSLLHSCYKGEDGSVSQIEKPILGFLDDYAFVIRGLLALYEASLDMQWLKWAQELQKKQNELFWDEAGGGYFTCSADDATVVLRLKEDHDGAEPSGNSVSCHNLLRLSVYADMRAAGGGAAERELARRLLSTFAPKLTAAPVALPEMMSALMLYTDSPTQVLIAGGRSDPRTLELVRVVCSRLLPGRVLAVSDPAAGESTPAAMSDMLLTRIRTVGDRPAAYVCLRYACSLPVTDVKQLETVLDEQPGATSSSK